MDGSFWNTTSSQRSLVSWDFTTPSVKTLTKQIQPFLDLSSSFVSPTSSQSNTDLLIQNDTGSTFVDFATAYPTIEYIPITANAYIDITDYIDTHIKYMHRDVKLAIDNTIRHIKIKRPDLSSLALTDAVMHIYNCMGFHYVYHYSSFASILSLEEQLEKIFFYFLNAAEDVELAPYELYYAYLFRVAHNAYKASKLLIREMRHRTIPNQVLGNLILSMIRSSITHKYINDSEDDPSAIIIALVTEGDYDA
ncbi:MAG: hypothetical protein M0Z81_02860 [Deltaproteobacteria bacterium]|jgi:hypothetical protein|nr:hypothetical protein [Deltaproteobacteria bacterium]